MVEDVYGRLGVRPVINAVANVTVLGGSVPAPAVREAMDEATRGLVDLPSLQRVVHERLAQLTRNEAAYVTSGAAAGIYLSTAAAVSRHYGKVIEQLGRAEINRAEVIVPAGCRYHYDVAVRQVGVELGEVAGDIDEIRARIGRDTVALFHAPAGWNAPGTPTMDEAAAAAHAAQLPLIVDAASQIPPIANLWGFANRGADVTIFSGGKALAGPQSTGLLVGSADFLRWVEAIGFPRHGFGRVFKVGRDEIVGLLTAVEVALGNDEPARRRWCEAQVAALIEAFMENPLLDVSREFPNIAGQALPYAVVRPRSPQADLERLSTDLRDGEPSIVVGRIPGSEKPADGFVVNTMALREGQMPLIITALLAAADRASSLESHRIS